MRPKSARISMALAPLAAALALAADDPPLPSIRALMHKQYTVSRAPLKAIKAEAAAEAPDWAKVAAAGERLEELGALLARHTARHGDPDAWRRRVEAHRADARSVGEAARDRDRDLLRDAHRRIAASCTPCHEAHRYDPDG